MGHPGAEENGPEYVIDNAAKNVLDHEAENAKTTTTQSSSTTQSVVSSSSRAVEYDHLDKYDYKSKLELTNAKKDS